MSLSSDALSRLPHVEGVFHYLAPMAEKPRNYTYDPPPGVARSNAVSEPHSMPVYDVRPVASELSVDGEGIQLVEQRSAVRGFEDEEEIRRVYYPEAERLVASATGASRVVVFDHTIRRRQPGAVDRAVGTPRQPVTRVHNDYTEISGPQRVRDLMGNEAEALLKKRFAVINVWRPIRGPLQDAPLAVCDAGSTAPDDFVGSDLVYRDRTGETYAVKYNPRHRWYYVPDMREDEALLLKCYDSARSGIARFAPHSAFEDPTAPADKLPRESIELRTLVFYDE
jgi:hypothetical protein